MGTTTASAPRRVRLTALALACLAALAGPVGAALAQSGDTAPAGGRSERGGQPGPSPERRDELAATARDEGTVSAIVGLRAGFRPEGELRAAEVAAQRQEIARVRRALLRELRGTGARLTHAYDTVPHVAVELTEQALRRAFRSDQVTGIVPDVPLHPQLSTSTELVQADRMHDLGLSGAGAMVAVLDTGVDTAHYFLGGRVVAEACYSTSQGPRTSLCPNGQDSQVGTGAGVHCEGFAGCDHGTHVAGIAAGQGHTFGGVAPSADLMSVQTFHVHNTSPDCPLPQGSPCLMASPGDLAKGLERVHALRDQHDIAVVNLSLGSAPQSAPCDSDPTWGALKDLIDNLRSANIATVAASGNHGATNGVSAPACISSAIAVGATTKSDTVWAGSNSHPSMLDLLAPGVSITSAVPDDGLGSKTGTSMAAPHVAGAWAVLRGYAPEATVTEILDGLKEAGKPILDTRGGTSVTVPRLRIHDAATGPLEPYSTCPRPFADVGSTHPFCPEISWLVAEGIAEGFGDGTFRPSLAVSRQAKAAFLFRLAGAPEGEWESDFGDVPETHRFYTEISWLAEQAITTGFDDGTFRPTDAVSRQAAAAFLFRLAGAPEGEWESDFSDVPEGHQFYTEISWLAEQAIAGGFADGTFRPSRPVSRQAVAAFLYRYDQR